MIPTQQDGNSEQPSTGGTINVIYRVSILLSSLWVIAPLVTVAAASAASQASPIPGAIPPGIAVPLPMAFHPNQGQTDGRVKFVYRGKDCTLFFARDEIVFSLRESSEGESPASELTRLNDPKDSAPPRILRLRFEGAGDDVRISGRERMAGSVNYLIGRAHDWLTGIPTFRKLAYEALYPGVDLVFYGNRGNLEFDLVVAPGADPDQIRFTIEGADELRVGDEGELLIQFNESALRLLEPLIYQATVSHKTGLREGAYRVHDQSSVSFSIGDYDRSKVLVIDPILIFSSYVGGADYDVGSAIALDQEGNIYIAGSTRSNDFPTENGYLESWQGGPEDAFVTKLRPDGSEILYSTYLGGSEIDAASGVAVDSMGQAYVAGRTKSGDFPTVNAFQSALGGGSEDGIDGFVAKLDSSGSQLVYSTYFGGSPSSGGTGDDLVADIAVDAQGRAYVIGWTAAEDFPTANPIQPALRGPLDAFVTKFSPSGTTLVYSTYLGGTSAEAGLGIAVDGRGFAYVVGVTFSSNFPTLNAAQGEEGGWGDVFVASLTSDGSFLPYATYLGGEHFDVATDIAVDTFGNAYIVGETGGDFPVLNGFQTEFGGGTDAFVAKLDRYGPLIYSTYLGGLSGEEQPMTVAVDILGRATVAGGTLSYDFPVFKAVQKTMGEFFDGFVTQLNADGSDLVFSTFLGGGDADRVRGVAVDRDGSIVVTGETYSFGFSTGPSLGVFHGGSDAFVAKIAESVALYFAQLGNGEGFRSELVLTNPSHDHVVSGRVDFFDDEGAPLLLGLLIGAEGGLPASRSSELVSGREINIAPLGVVVLSTDGIGDLAVGSAVVISDGALGGVVRFTIPGIGIAGVGSGEAHEELIAPVRRRSGGMNSGIALCNTGATPVMLELSLRNKAGEPVAFGTRTVEDFPGQGHLARFIDELFPDADLDDFEGTLTVEVSGGKVAATALEQGKQPGEFTTLPVLRVH